jgi:sulfite oxidase
VQAEPSTSFFQRDDYTIDGDQLDELPLSSAVCRSARRLPGGAIRLEGWAMGEGGRSVERVEVSCDGGRTWGPAELVGAGEPWTWRLWRADVAVPPGATEVVVRAADDSGRLQPEHVSWTANPRGYLNNAWPRLPIE